MALRYELSRDLRAIYLHRLVPSKANSAAASARFLTRVRLTAPTARQRAIMLTATEEETRQVREYFEGQAPDLRVEFVQKVYAETILGHCHDVWDIHTDKDRWWVITNPSNLYSQEDFPNLDLALTFHVGLCLRIPGSERQKLSELPIEPFAQCYRYMAEAQGALSQAQEVLDYQAIGMKCREALLAFADAAQTILPWTSSEQRPKRSDLRAWAEHICNVTLAGESHKERRHLFKAQLESAWTFANWLTHAKGSKWHDAEASCATTENAISLCTSAVIRYVRGVPEACPACGSHRLSPQRGFRGDLPESVWERPTCDRCGWTGEAVRIKSVPESPDRVDQAPPSGECVIPTVPLRSLKKANTRKVQSANQRSK